VRFCGRRGEVNLKGKVHEAIQSEIQKYRDWIIRRIEGRKFRLGGEKKSCLKMGRKEVLLMVKFSSVLYGCGEDLRRF
jgi:hypothetical protein